MRALLVFSALLLSACATVHPGEFAKPVSGETDKGLLISGEQLNDSNEEPFQLVGITFENQTDQWLRIEKVDVVISAKNVTSHSLVLGKDLVYWAEAKAARAALKEKENRLALAMLGGAVAATAGAASRNDTLLLSGVGVYLAAGTWAISDSVRAEVRAGENPKTVPDTHIHTPFSVPGQGFMRRWVLLNIPRGEAFVTVAVNIQYTDGRSEVRSIKVQ